MTNKDFFILVGGEVKNYFDDANNLTKEGEFKFLLVKENHPMAIWQMLLMIEGQPYSFHAEALLAHMQSKGLLEIIVHGGGIIFFLETMEEAVVKSLSYAFGSVNEDELKFILCAAIKTLKTIQTTEIVFIKEALNDHRLWYLGQVAKEAAKKII